jgi:hypothetical protein
VTPEERATQDLIELKLREAIALGLTFGHCVKVFAGESASEKIYAGGAAARPRRRARS